MLWHDDVSPPLRRPSKFKVSFSHTIGVGVGIELMEVHLQVLLASDDSIVNVLPIFVAFRVLGFELGR